MNETDILRPETWPPWVRVSVWVAAAAATTYQVIALRSESRQLDKLRREIRNMRAELDLDRPKKRNGDRNG